LLNDYPKRGFQPKASQIFYSLVCWRFVRRFTLLI